MNRIKKMTQEVIDKYPGDIEALRIDWLEIIDNIIEIASDPPDSRKCRVKTIDNYSYEKCPACANKLCSEMFGSEFCKAHYDPGIGEEIENNN
jgi:hypothetical protein